MEPPPFALVKAETRSPQPRPAAERRAVLPCRQPAVATPALLVRRPLALTPQRNACANLALEHCRRAVLEGPVLLVGA